VDLSPGLRQPGNVLVVTGDEDEFAENVVVHLDGRIQLREGWIHIHRLVDGGSDERSTSLGRAGRGGWSRGLSRAAGRQDSGDSPRRDGEATQHADVMHELPARDAPGTELPRKIGDLLVLIAHSFDPPLDLAELPCFISD